MEVNHRKCAVMHLSALLLLNQTIRKMEKANILWMYITWKPILTSRKKSCMLESCKILANIILWALLTLQLPVRLMKFMLSVFSHGYSTTVVQCFFNITAKWLTSINWFGAKALYRAWREQQNIWFSQLSI